MDQRMLKAIMDMMGGGDTNPLANKKFAGTFDGFEIYNEGQRPVVDLVARLADRIVEHAPKLIAGENPFQEGKILSIWSPPGRGKSHLVEAFINRIKRADPRVLKQVQYTTEFVQQMGCPCPTDHFEEPIIIADDLFKGDSDSVGVGQLSEDDIRAFQKFAVTTWERRRFVLITCNFPVLTEMFERVRALDMVGRSSSRLNGLIAASKELELPGKDYRGHLADLRRAASDEFTI